METNFHFLFHFFIPFFPLFFPFFPSCLSFPIFSLLCCSFSPYMLFVKQITLQDDVLHVQKLPDFGGRINARACELLLQYLTAPYLRIPLVLRFFAAPEMTTALANEQLQDMLDAVLFEPGAWRSSDDVKCPEQVPAPNRTHLSTPLGLLFNELQKSPDGVLVAVDKLLANVMELDAGRYDAGSTPAILYVVRLVVRIQSFVHLLLRHAVFTGAANREEVEEAMGGRSISAKSEGTAMTGVGGSTYVRGFDCNTELAQKLIVYCKRWRYDALHRVFPMLLTWARRAVAQGAVGALCVVRAHLAYLFRNAHIRLPTDIESGTISEQLTVRTILCSQIYLTASYRFDVEPQSSEVLKRFGRSTNASKKKKQKKQKVSSKDKKKKKGKKKERERTLFNEEYGKAKDGLDDDDTEMLVNTSLGIPQMEMFSLFQLKRGDVLSWLEKNPSAANDIMEEAVRVVTNKSTEEARKKLDTDLASLENNVRVRVGSRTRAATLEARSWKPLSAKMCSGRFVPDTEAEARRRQLTNIDDASSETPYEEWLRQTTTLGVDTEVNVQLGEFTLKKHRVEPVDPRMTQFADFRAVFGGDVTAGSTTGTTGFQCAEVKNTTHRLWVRMVGRRHDLRLWSAPQDRDPKHGCWPSRGPFNRLFPSQIRGSTETWILDALRPHVSSIPNDRRRHIEIHLHNNVHSGSAVMARLAVTTLDPESVARASQDKNVVPFAIALREIVIVRHPTPTVHVYDVVEHGRHFRRTLVWTSDRHRTLSELVRQPSLSDILMSPMRARPSLIVTRSLTSEMGTQEFVPAKFLRGIIPEVLLWQYKFWRQHRASDDLGVDGKRTDIIIGYRRPSGTSKDYDEFQRFSQIKITLIHEKPDDVAGQCETESLAIVERKSLVHHTTTTSTRRSSSSSSSSSTALGEAASKTNSNKTTETVTTLLRAPTRRSIIGIGHNDVVDVDAPTFTLLGLLHGPPAERTSPLRALCELMLRLDSLPWCLCWTKQRVLGSDSSKDGLSIDLVELPRLGLTFQAKEKESMVDNRKTKETRLYSVDHEGLFVSNEATTCESTRDLLKGLPHAVVLERSGDGALFLLLPAGAKPEVEWDVGSGGLASCNLALDRTDPTWLSNLGDVRHYLYPVHMSRRFLFTPTLAHGMYLMLLRWIDGQYGEVFQLADFCVTDTSLKSDEEQIFQQIMTIAGSDPSGDAVACRVKLILIFSGTPMSNLRKEHVSTATSSAAARAWSPTVQLEAYVSRLAHVSGRCRLSRNEEMLVLEMCRAECKRLKQEMPTSLTNRLTFLSILEDAASSDGGGRASESFGVAAMVPDSPTFPDYDSVVDDSCYTVEDGILKKFTTLSYDKRKPDTMQGTPGLRSLHTWLSRPRDTIMRLRGGKDSLGFLFLYELMTNRAKLKILPNDDPYNWGCVLLRMMPPIDWADKWRQRNGRKVADVTNSKGGGGGGDVLLSILRCMANNSHIVKDDNFPLFEDKRGFKFTTMFRSSNVLQTLLKALKETFSKKKSLIRWPALQAVGQGQSRGGSRDAFNHYVPPIMIRYRSAMELFKVDRTLVAPRVPNYLCSKRVLRPIEFEGCRVTERDLLDFANRPLEHVVDGVEIGHYVVEKSRSDEGLPALSTDLPFDVDLSKHPNARSSVADTILHRLTEDVSNYAVSQNNCTEVRLAGGFSSLEECANIVQNPTSSVAEETLTFLDDLRKTLSTAHKRDSDFMKRATRSLMRLANHVDPNPPGRSAPLEQRRAHRHRLSVLMARDHGQVPELWFSLLVGTLLSDRGFDELQKLNPFLSDRQLRAVQDLLVGLMLTVVRLGQVSRCVTATSELYDMVSSLSAVSATSTTEGEAVTAQDVFMLSKSVAAQLTTRRFYVRKDDAGNLAYDPRLLVFEFMQDIVLRKAQVELIFQFRDQCIDGGESRCHQMLMGAGKTTVVGPLLALMLGDGKRLVTQVVPRALWEFSCGVMRSRFSAVIRKQVYTFQYDRFKPPDDAMLQKLLKARNAGGVVIANPTTIKSFALKFVETVNAIIETRSAIQDHAQDSTTRSFSLLALIGRAKDIVGDDLQTLLSTLQRQAQLCTKILDVFRTGTLLLDEVDLILHPLKSELNWPMGAKDPLDFTTATRSRNSKGGRGEVGLRWQVPFHLLDAVFFASTSEEHHKDDDMMEGSDGSSRARHKKKSLIESREAHSIIHKIRAEVNQGAADKLLQRSPHLVLASKRWYNDVLMPLLVDWSLLWLAEKKVVGVKDDDMRSYLLYRNHAQHEGDTLHKSEGVNAVNAVKRAQLGDDQTKMINLVHDWIHYFMPHVLRKIDRVHYGLLQPAELQRALSLDPNMPESRKLVAVPFVGKDVPSRASEFAHPDVVIGLTIAAYRYEGLRFHDFHEVLLELRQRMETESGPYPKRTTTSIYNEWITMAGGRVRGTAMEQHPSESDTRTHEEREDALARVITQAELAQRPDEDLFQDIWPLHLVDLGDPEQMGVLYRLLRHSPMVVEHYLSEFVFPQTCRHQGVKLSACGQALGGNLLFNQRLGFSGTPSDLLPVELGKCHYERGSDAKMLRYLTDPEVTSQEILPSSWTVRYILDHVAGIHVPGPSIYHALIDTGALVTGMSNLEVAQYLLENGLRGIDGVVFLDEEDRKMICVRKGYRVMKVAQSGVPLNRRFAFYDQIHTTGMDIKHRLGAHAALTLGKDMVFRDYAQGMS